MPVSRVTQPSRRLKSGAADPVAAFGWVEDVVAEHAFGSLVDDVVEEDLSDEKGLVFDEK